MHSSSLTSSNKCFQLTLQIDGNLVLYYQATGAALWSSGTMNSGSLRAIMQNDGNFVLYNSDNQPKWSSGTGGNTGSNLIMQDDGNLVIYNSQSKPIWATHTFAKCPGEIYKFKYCQIVKKNFSCKQTFFNF